MSMKSMWWLLFFACSLALTRTLTHRDHYNHNDDAMRPYIVLSILTGLVAFLFYLTLIWASKPPNVSFSYVPPLPPTLESMQQTNKLTRACVLLDRCFYGLARSSRSYCESHDLEGRIVRDFRSVAELFRSNLNDGWDVGASIAAYADGQEGMPSNLGERVCPCTRH